MKTFRSAKEFSWDQANSRKNWLKHKVTTNEAEEVFYDQKRRRFPDPTHSTPAEKRSIIIGSTKAKRLLFVVYTYRNSKIRIISARDMNIKERQLYEKTT